MRDDRRSYIAVGAFVVAMLAALVLWLATLSGRGFAAHSYFVVYDNVLGLAEGTQVLYDGFPVGQITGIEPTLREGKRAFRIDLGIRRDWELPEDSVATVAAPGLLSAVVIDIQGGISPTALQPGSEVRGLPASNVFTVVSDVASQLTDLSENSVKPLLESLGKGTPQIVSNIEDFTGALNVTLERIDALLSPATIQRIDVERLRGRLRRSRAHARRARQADRHRRSPAGSQRGRGRPRDHRSPRLARGRGAAHRRHRPQPRALDAQPLRVLAPDP
jgi:phospholipid/cholesterol/gamma-HCH transport system substrate-binding protein